MDYNDNLEKTGGADRMTWDRLETLAAYRDKLEGILQSLETSVGVDPDPTQSDKVWKKETKRLLRSAEHALMEACTIYWKVADYPKLVKQGGSRSRRMFRSVRDSVYKAQRQMEQGFFDTGYRVGTGFDVIHRKGSKTKSTKTKLWYEYLAWNYHQWSQKTFRRHGYKLSLNWYQDRDKPMPVKYWTIVAALIDDMSGHEYQPGSHPSYFAEDQEGETEHDLLVGLGLDVAYVLEGGGGPRGWIDERGVLLLWLLNQDLDPTEEELFVLWFRVGYFRSPLR